MQVVLESQERADVARRKLRLIAAPDVEHLHRGYSRRSEEPRKLRPFQLVLTWRQGQLSNFAVHGRRVKKDGTAGALEDTLRFRFAKDTGPWMGSSGYGQQPVVVPDWLLQLVREHILDVPPFDPYTDEPA